MSFKAIRLEIENGVALLTLNRPERLNAMNDELMVEVRQALQGIGPEVRCLMLTGAGRGFCAGADLSQPQMASGTGNGVDLGATLERNYHPVIKHLRTLEIPTVAAVNGPAAGAGMSLALACDIVIAARSASFLQAFANIGLIPDAGSTYFLPRLVGRARAAGLAMLGEKLPAETAAEWGLIWKCVDDEQLLPEAWAVARKFAKGPTRGLALTRKVLQESWAHDLEGQLDLERDLQREAGRTEDFMEGVTAFLQKRPAAFKGR